MSRKAAAAERRASRQAKKGLWKPKASVQPRAMGRAPAAGTGPTGLASVSVSPDLNCDVTTTVDSAPSFYGGDACGTFFAVDGTVYGPASVPAGLSAGGLTPVSQTTTGSGTTGDPYVISTVVDVGSTGITAIETDTWAVGASSYTTSVQLDNTDSVAHSLHVYRAGDCYFDSSDYSFGEIAGLAGLPAGAVACRAAWDQSVPGNRMMEWVPQTPGTTYVEDFYGTMWQDVGTGGDLPDTCQCTSYIDSSMAIAWSGTLGAGATQSYDSSLVFNDNAPGSTPSVGEQGGGPNGSEYSTTCYADDPVNCATGNFFHQSTDFSIPGRGVPLSLQRSYSSAAAATDGPFGFGWTDSYNMSLITDNAGDVTVNQENGSTITFSPDGSGGFTAPPRVFAALVQNGDGSFTLTRQQTQVQYNFSAAGQLTSEVDRNGYVTNLAYTGGNLTSVTAPAGRTLTFTYSGSHIASITDPAGRTYSYSYDGSGNLVKVTDPLGRSYTFTYDTSHRLLTITDPRGGTVTNTYDSQGRVVSQTDADGNTTTWSYTGDPASSSGGTTTMTDPLGNQTVYSYLNLELMAVTHGAGTADAATTSYTYDPATLGVATVTDPNGNVTVSTYDSNGNLLSTTGPLGNTTSYTYNSSDEVLTKTSPLGETTYYSYDGSGNLQSVTDPLGNATSYSYGDSAHPGDITSVTDANGNVTSYTYDANGDVASKSLSPSSGVTDTTAYAYNADGERTCEASPKATAANVTCPPAGSPPVSDTTATAYDAAGQVISVTDPDGQTTSYAYDPDGHLSRFTDPNGNATQYAYNGNGQQTKVTLPDGTTRSSSYDADGNLVSQTDGSGNVTHYSYDALNRTASMTNPLGQTTGYGYDLAGNRTSLTNAAGGVTSFAYDQANELSGITYSDGSTPGVSISYDADGQRASMTDGTGTASYSYDSDGRLTSVTDGAGNTISYGYDPSGRLTSLTYPSGNTVNRSYDGAGQLTAVTDWLGNTTRFGYDANGNLATEAYPNGVQAVSAYNNANQLTSITDKTASATLASFAYTRDNKGQLTATAETGAVQGTHDYSYTQLSQLASENTAPYSYDTAGNLTKLANGTTQSFNAGDELTTAQLPANPKPPVVDKVVSANHTSSGTSITSPALTTTSSNELVVAFISATGSSTSTQKITKISGGGLTWTRVTRANSQPGTAEIWQAHAASPLASVKITATLAHADHGSITVTAFTGANSVTGAHGAASGHSAAPAASLITTGPDSLVWGAGEDATAAKARTPATGQTLVHQFLDTASHATYWAQKTSTVTTSGTTVKLADTIAASDHWNMTAAEITAAATAGQVNYSYDSRGNLTGISPSNAPAAALGYDQANRLISYGATATYAYNGDGLRMSTTVGTTTTAFSWDQSGYLPLLLAAGPTAYIYGPGGQPIEQVHGSTVTYLQADQQGSTRLLTNSSGAVVGTYTYSPYGTVTSHTGTATAALQYTGQYTDAESGLIYLRARYYNPQTGQFLSVDPALALTNSPYSYVDGNPVNRADPSGRLFGFDSLLGAAIGGVVGTVAGTAGYLTSVATGQQQWSLRGQLGATFGGLVGGAVGGACVGTTWVAFAACGAAGGITGTLVNDAVSGQPITATGLLEGAGFGAVGGVVGGKLFPLVGFQPYRLTNVWNPGPNSIRLYGQAIIGGVIGLYQGLFDPTPVC
jgi:RHS repeat-associated protein